VGVQGSERGREGGRERERGEKEKEEVLFTAYTK
jgi:hypothetical protein